MSTGSTVSETTVPWRVGTVSKEAVRSIVIPAAISVALWSTTVETVAAHTLAPDDTARRSSVIAATANLVLGTDRSDLAAIAQIRRLASYGDGWKGPDSVGATSRACEDAEGFARALFQVPNLIAPRIGMAADGEISFYWKTPRVVLNLGFVGDGTYSYFAKTSVGLSFADDSAPAIQLLPQALLDFLSAEA